MLNAMALAFNRAGSSFQSNIDGSLAVRLIQGFISQNGVICAQLAQRNLTGPKNWLEGVWGYYHLFCKDRADNEMMTGGLGAKWYLQDFGYKTAPSCGATISATDAALELLQEHAIEPDDIERIDIRMASAPTFYLVGHEFEIGDNPQVNAQFNVRYCVANIILRHCAELEHFSPRLVTEPRIMDLTRKIASHLEPALAEGRPELAARVLLDVRLKDGRTLSARVDSPSGFPPRGMTEDQHLKHFRDNVAYGGAPISGKNIATILSMMQGLEQLADVRDVIPMMLTDDASKLSDTLSAEPA
jgi:2-methylcitrate dehydratase PrpD